MDCLMTFKNTYAVLKAEMVLKNKNIVFRLLPAPKLLSTACALVIGFNQSDQITIEGLLNASRIKIQDIYIKEEERYVKV
jgi:Putative Se/S carrier protein-like